MRKKCKQDNKTYHSFEDYEKEVFPNSYKNKLKDEKEGEPGAFGSKLGIEFLETLRHRLTKR